jgi:hypothetical protein
MSPAVYPFELCFPSIPKGELAMRRSFLLALALLSLAPGRSAFAQVTAATSDVPDCISVAPPPLVAGNPIGRYIVTVRDAASLPVPGAPVRLEINPATLPMIAWCGGVPPGAPPGVLGGTTNAVGQVEFDLLGGGCVMSTVQPCATPVAKVSVEGPPGIGGQFSEDIFCLNSPDAVNDPGVLPSCPAMNNCFGGVTRVALSDAVFHTRCIKLGLVCPCTKFSPPFGAPVNLTDAVYLTPFIKAGNICPC